MLLSVIVQAADHGFGKHARRLPWTLALFADRRGRWHEWAAAQQIRPAAAQRLGDGAGQAHAHLDIGYIDTRLGRYEEAETHLGESLSLFRQLRPSLSGPSAHCVLHRNRAPGHGLRIDWGRIEDGGAHSFA